MTHNFDDSLAWSKGQTCGDDIATIRAMLVGCISVEQSSQLLDTNGVDYVATLRRGAQVLIDAKNRRKGCGRFWKQGPELALEIWSVCPFGKYRTPESKQKVGWTLCEAKRVDLIFFKFDRADTDEVFLVGYQHLRIAFRKNFRTWREHYKEDVQDNGKWESCALFVPASVVLDAITECSKGRLAA